jgi:hypothetical protein
MFDDGLDLPFRLLTSRFFSAKRSEYEADHVTVNLQKLSAANRSRGGFSSDQ